MRWRCNKSREKSEKGDKLKRKWMKVIREDIRVCRRDEDTVKDSIEWKGTIRMANPTRVG